MFSKQNKVNLSSKNSSDVDLLNEPPESLCKPTSVRPRLAKNKAYASAVQRAWKHEIEESSHALVATNDGASLVHNSPLSYKVVEEDGSISKLYGHVYFPSKHKDESHRNPAVVLYHTGAGPHDIFLHWKASTLALNMGYTVLIADMLSDDVGWAWNDDRTQYELTRKSLLQIKNGKRDCLRKRIKASLKTLKQIQGVDPNRIGAIGWCFGGQIALEIVNMRTDVEGLKALATFHGVFDGVTSMMEDSPEKLQAHDNDKQSIDRTILPRVLLCNGEDDPFVTTEDKFLFQERLLRHDWKWVDYKGCLHGFSNPAQASNPNPKFAYNEHAAQESWNSVCEFLKNTLEMNF